MTGLRSFFCVISVCMLLVLPGRTEAQERFYAIDTIQDIEIIFPFSNWDYRMDTAKYGAETYTMASQVIINGQVFDSVGVKYKGNSSYDSTRSKNPLHIKLSYVYDSADYDGCNDIKLSTGFADPTSVREVLGYKILRNYMPAPRCNFARIKINGVYYGVYSSAEDIDNGFNREHFYSNNNSFFKCNPVSVVSGNIPNLLYLGTDSSNYYSRYEIKSDIAWKDLIGLCDTLANNFPELDTILDIDRALWMLAFNNVTVNLDSYSGAFAQNYYLYRDDNGRFQPIIWDLNMCFGGFQSTGTGVLSTSGMQQMTPLLHSTYGARPLIMKLLSDSLYKRMYLAHLRTITNEYFANGLYETEAQTLQALVDTSVQNETFSFYSYSQFQQSLTTGVGATPGLTDLMDNRATYLTGTTIFQQTPPAISAISVSPQIPVYNDTAWINCISTNATLVQLGYRDQVYKRFVRTTMYDDGLHHDGAAGDNVYGAGITVTAYKMQYYIYVENAAAGLFSPERAEYNYYTFTSNLASPVAGNIIINEVMAVNQADTTDSDLQHEDWIELYNTTAAPLHLYGLYLSDEAGNLDKFALPENLVIPANGYVTIWADGDNTIAAPAHTDFFLDADGDQVFLSDSDGIIMDSISFGTQYIDESMGRCSGTTVRFVRLSNPTYNAANDCSSMIEDTPEATLAYPNPATTSFTVVTNQAEAVTCQLLNIRGQLVTSATFTNDKATFYTAELPAGLYFYRLNKTDGSYIESGKVMVIHN